MWFTFTDFELMKGACVFLTLAMLNCFLAAMDTLNFTTAAQNIHITQPAFSRNIASLENELGVQLFVRSKQNGLKATPAAEEYSRGLQELADAYERLMQRTMRISRGEEGKLVVGILNGLCVDSWTKQCIQTMAEEHPYVEIQLLCYPYRELIRSVEEGKSDTCIVLTNAVKDRENLRYAEIVAVENYLAVPACLHSNTEVEHSLAEYANETFILSEDAPELNRLLVSVCRSAGFEPRTRMAPDFETKMLWIEFGQGVGVHSKEHYIKNSVNVDFVKVREIGEENYAMIWQKDNHNPVLELFRSVFQNLKTDHTDNKLKSSI